jgi:hypothetical protein
VPDVVMGRLLLEIEDPSSAASSRLDQCVTPSRSGGGSACAYNYRKPAPDQRVSSNFLTKILSKSHASPDLLGLLGEYASRCRAGNADYCREFCIRDGVTELFATVCQAVRSTRSLSIIKPSTSKARAEMLRVPSSVYVTMCAFFR